MKQFMQTLVLLVGEGPVEIASRNIERPPIYWRIKECLEAAGDDPEKFILEWKRSSQVLNLTKGSPIIGPRVWVRHRYTHEVLHPKLREAVLRESGNVCHYCGGAAATVDHVIPRKQGGLHTRKNLVAACQKCNSSKSARTPEQWKASLLKKQQEKEAQQEWASNVLCRLEAENAS